jgi:hypothetical protein
MVKERGGSFEQARAIAAVLFTCATLLVVVRAQQPAPKFGGAYASLDERRQAFVKDWVARFVKTTGQPLEPAAFYDSVLTLSDKTTFEAVTNALMTTQLTDASGAGLGDALAIVDHVDTIRGEVAGASGDQQFRMYVRLVRDAVQTLGRSREFKRGADNSVYHKGYPMNYREQGGLPSVQVSVALDGRHADIDVDYRSSSFPLGLFNGHLTASNSDVRAGNNYDRHINRWTGFQNWWRGFFGVRQDRDPDVASAPGPLSLPTTPRVGKKHIDVMVSDFLNAWLIEGDVMAAMSYVSPRSYACLARNSDDPAAFDFSMAPRQLLVNLKSAHDALGPHTSLDGLVVGTHWTRSGLRVVPQPSHAHFVLYSVRDDVAMSFDCKSPLKLGDPETAGRTFGNYFGATFYIAGRRDFPVALLWGQDDGFWKIVSWQIGSSEDATPAPQTDPRPETPPTRADPTLVRAAREFLEHWLVRKDYDAAFASLSPEAYACYDLERDPAAPASASPEDAGRRLRAGLEASGQSVGAIKKLDEVLVAAEPVHPTIRVMDHQFARVFSLADIPNALADVVECRARATGTPTPDRIPLQYGNAFVMTVRFKTRSGDAPILRALWRKKNGAWRITSYAVEQT